MPTHRTLAGDELTYPTPTGRLASFLERVVAAAADPGVGTEAMTALVYSTDNPLLGPSSSAAFPERGSANEATWASPLWHVMLDLLESKRIAIAESSPTMRINEAAGKLGLTEDAVRKAAIAGNLDGEMREGLWFVTPGSVSTYRERVVRRGRWPATPLTIRTGVHRGHRLSANCPPSTTRTTVRKSIADLTIPDFQRVIVRITWKSDDGAKQRRLLILEPDPSAAEANEYRWPREFGKDAFFVRGKFRIAKRIKDSVRAARAWKSLEPE